MASVRDENPNRARAKQPALQRSANQDFWAPIDGQAGGTWWAVNRIGHTVILLNGAFINHLPNTRTYRKSRGLIVKELAEQMDLVDHWENLDLTDIEPFTLVIRQNNQVFDCRWDGRKKHTKELNPKEAAIWSSAPLYTREIQRYREQLFADFTQNDLIDIPEILEFLESYSDKDNGFIMRRWDFLQSLSISVFRFNGNDFDLFYKDLITGETSSQTHQLSKS